MRMKTLVDTLKRYHVIIFLSGTHNENAHGATEGFEKQRQSLVRHQKTSRFKHKHEFQPVAGKYCRVSGFFNYLQVYKLT